MRWISQNDLSFERIACCWLISRFIDFDAHISLIDEADLARGAVRSAMPFALGTGEGGSFASLLDSFALRQNRALGELSDIVRRQSLDHPHIAVMPDGMRLLLDGLGMIHGATTRMLQTTFDILDALYASSCERLGLQWAAAPSSNVQISQRYPRRSGAARPGQTVIAAMPRAPAPPRYPNSAVIDA